MMHIRPFVSAGTTLALAVFGLAACSSSGGAGGFAGGENSTAAKCSDGAFNWAVAVPLSGPLATIGDAQLKGMKAAVDVVNDAGGINGRKVVIKVRDNRGEATESVNVAQKALRGQPKPDLMFPGGQSAQAVPALPLMNDAKVLHALSNSSTAINAPEKYPYAFGVANTSPYKVDALLDWVTEEGHHNIGVLVTDDELGSDLLKTFESVAGEKGVKLSSEKVPAGVVDPTAQLGRVRAGKPDALVVATGPGPSTAAVLKARQTLGWDLPVLLDDSSSAIDLGALPNETLEDTVLMMDAYGVAGQEVRDTEAFKAYDTALRKYEKDFPFSANVYAIAYSTLIVSKAAFEKADSCDPDEVREAWESLSVDDVDHWFMTKELGLSKDNHAVVWTVDDFAFFPAEGTQFEDGVFVPADGS